MASTNRLLIGIVVGIVLLVVAAFAVTLFRREPAFQAEDNPEGVAHNYLLALQREDYERAYGYLSSTLEGRPVSVKRFIEDAESYYRSWSATDTTLAVESAKVTDDGAVVTVRESRFYGGDLFDSSQHTSVFEMELQLEDGEWKIVDSDRYFAWAWKAIPAPGPRASVSLVPGGVEIVQGESISVTIHIANATNLYGVEVHLTYEEGLRVDGIIPGTCAADIVVPLQAIDGRIDFAASRTATSPPFSGDCYAAAFTLTGERPGAHTIAFDTVILANRFGDALSVTTRDGTIIVVAATPQPTATSAAS